VSLKILKKQRDYSLFGSLSKNVALRAPGDVDLR
jgi:hypothetical protein